MNTKLELKLVIKVSIYWEWVKGYDKSHICQSFQMLQTSQNPQK